MKKMAARSMSRSSSPDSPIHRGLSCVDETLAAAADEAAADEAVGICEKDISMEQMSRLWSKGKKMGSW